MDRLIVNPDPTTVTVWSDIGCPWATLALERLRQRARDRGLAIRIDHRAFPLELFNHRPTPKPILDAEIVAIAGLRPELGWRLWTEPEYTYPGTTLPAMEAVQACKAPAVGGLAASDELDAALRRAFYVDCRCISMHDEILDVAKECPGVDVAELARVLRTGSARAAVHAQFDAAGTDAVRGSPHLFTAAGLAMHNPGATYHWTAPPPEGLPRLDHYHDAWTDRVFESLDLSGG